MGVMYVALPLSHFIRISLLPNGRIWILFLMSVVWLNDTAAYYTGSAIGRHKLSPRVSPNKTVEGAIGGVIGGLAAAFLFNRFFETGLAAKDVVFISVFLGMVSLLGDLSESLLKRGAGVKDSGSIIPGHGGVLDRLDSIIFSVPALYYYLIWRVAA
ncbi:MAG: phosphatidate cytidylyltransferase [Deltaproteobacteria bacterium]|nr:phosphatidate cytidylyltransferase [Deltaproteobacteria bacterium]